jgi:putative membrane protein
MNRKTSTLLSLGVSAVLIAVGVWFLYDHNIDIWPEHHHWAMGHHGMMGGGMGIIMIIFWIVLIASFVLLISGVINALRRPKQNQDNTSSSLDILKQRYARGEIDTAEYEEKYQKLLI